MPAKEKPKMPPRTEVKKRFDPTVSPEDIAEIGRLQKEKEELIAKQAVRSAAMYHDEPARFILECIRWKELGEDDQPTKYQLKNLTRLVHAKRLAVRGPHGLGKTAQNAWVVLWFALTRDAVGEDWKAITTASAWRQLTHFLWPEIRKWANLLDWERLGREPFTRDEMMRMNLRLEHGEAFAVACEDPATIEGAHADQMLYVYDEAKTIPDATFTASEGAFSGAGADTRMEAFALAASTPGDPTGLFYDIHARKAGLQSWSAVHVTLEEAKEAKRISDDWVRERREQWGEGSQVFINRVLGNFAPSDEDGVIPLRHVELAVERWEAMRQIDENGHASFDAETLGPLTGLGVDVARSGHDKTVVARKYGFVIAELRRYTYADLMETVGMIRTALPKETHAIPIVDVVGLGAGVVDRLREMGFMVRGFHASERCDMRDRTGELGYLNLRAAAWWNLREMLDPNSGFPIALPPDDTLIGDLTTPKWKMTSGGKIQIEGKDDLRKRLNGRSTDTGDSVVMAFWLDAGPSINAPIFTTQASRWSPVMQKPAVR